LVMVRWKPLCIATNGSVYFQFMVAVK
jgi:hypothetical protein